MDHRKKLFGVGICLAAIVAAAFFAGSIMGRSLSFVPPLTVLGDVGEVLSVRDIREIGAPEKITVEKRGYQAVKLAALIKKALPQGPVKKIFFVAGDGFTSAIEADGLDQSYLSFTRDNGWVALNLRHPISANAKMIQEIILVADSASSPNRFTVQNGRDFLNLTVGQLYTGMVLSYPYFEGQAVVERAGRTYEDSVFTRRRVFRLSDLTPLDREAQVMLWGEKGEYRLVDQSGYYELCGNYVNYIRPETREKMEKVRWAVINPPLANIMDTYFDGTHYLEKGENVLVVLLDGVSCRDYQDALERGMAPFLKKNAGATEAMGVYPLRDQVWLASILTGLPPAENGVLAQNGKNLTASTLGTKAEELGKKVLLLEAGGLLPTPGGIPVGDDNGSGSADDEIYARLLKSIGDNYGLTLVRFDSIGAAQARFGTQSVQAENALSQIDAYINEMVHRWPGKIIVTALPGTHGDMGDHLSPERLYVPYLLLSGKKSE
ncbi:hypothetical protein [Candidatus Formimonas warabiya]|uniref:Alkaline phosphatase family protein n=1 Tax=Formimonas warabiya TaxID=1761012 RepID=A0A3G1KQZ7_FORW1|nr:hypothetical protein [Candidatus Formimonas warabiya]ATW24902.1 hypothetical protein DCMF_09075 [Candidatus Formimonas warabiya]